MQAEGREVQLKRERHAAPVLPELHAHLQFPAPNGTLPVEPAAGVRTGVRTALSGLGLRTCWNRLRCSVSTCATQQKSAAESAGNALENTIQTPQWVTKLCMLHVS